jgi:peptide/nickel transport system substrate-binding protein
MKACARAWAVVSLICATLPVACVASAESKGGTLRIYHRDSPPSASIHEEATNSTVIPFMSVYNNLVLYKQDVPKNSLDTIVPDLAESWSWDASKTKLTFKLRQGVKWHDGKPFTAKDVQCTWDLLTGKAKTGLRKNPRKSWYSNLDHVTADSDTQATFHLHRPQPALIALLASGYSPVYPCHVSPRDMRLNPVGTGPFKFVEFKVNEHIKLTRNPDYWKKGKPEVDAIEFKIVANRSTAILAFIADEFDMTFPYEVTIPLLKDVKAQAPKAVCELRSTNVSNNLIVNRDAPPFDNAEIRKAMALALDRKAFIDILFEGSASIGGAMLPAPDGNWGMPKEMLEKLPGYGPDVAKNREAARKLMKTVGYGPEKRLPVKISTRNIAQYRDAAVILLDQLKDIYIDGELDVVETANWHAKVTRKDYQVGMNLTGSGVDDPDQQFYENYKCGSERNYTGYCNHDLDALFDEQSAEADQEKRKRMVWEIDQKLQEDGARPIISHNRAATCMSPKVKNFTTMANSVYNGWRFEYIALAK